MKNITDNKTKSLMDLNANLSIRDYKVCLEGDVNFGEKRYDLDVAVPLMTIAAVVLPTLIPAHKFKLLRRVFA